jgi:signal transduction histidine kinase
MRVYRDKSTGAGVLTLTLASASPVLAAESGAAISGFDATLVAVAAAACATAVGVYVNARRRDRDLAARTARMAADTAGLQALLATAPGCCCGWTVDGKEVRSGKLSELLGLNGGDLASFEALGDAFDEASFMRLHKSVHDLRNQGSDFAMDLTTRNGGRTIAAEGSAIHDQNGAVLGYVVWFRDVSQDRSDLNRFRQLAAAASAERDRMLELTNGSPIPLWRRGENLDLVWCNKAYAAVVETEPELAVAPPGMELVSSLDPEQGRRLAQQAIEAGTPQVEQRYYVVGGERRAFDVVEAPLPSGEGTVGIARDVTDREQARAELVRHTDANHEVLQNVSTAIAIYGADKRLEIYNRPYAQLWHLDESWLDTHPHFGEVLEAKRERRRLPEQADFQAFKQEQATLFGSVIDSAVEETMHLPDGTALKVSITPHPLGGLVFMYDDVTNQLDLERAHRTLGAVQRASLDNLYEGVAVFGSDGRLQLHNPAFAKIWLLSEEQLADEPHISEVIESIRHLYPAESDWPQLKDRIIAQWVERQARTGRIDRPDGNVIDYASVPLPDGAVLFTYLDVTDSIRIERALRERNEALQTADQLKSEFIANVSYELRTPLNTIIGFAEILANQYFGKLNDQQMEYSQGILDSSNHLLLLINDILDLATIEAGHMVLEPEPFDLHGMLSSVIALGRERARQENITLALDCPVDIGAIEADERRIKQVMFNLLSNSIKFTPPGGTITIGAVHKQDETVLWVDDTGVGIAVDEQDQVFEKFHKGAGPDRQRGAGLGLSLVKSFVELHGGRLDLKSSPHHGTCVTCHLPTQAPAGVASQQGDAAE